MNSISFYEKNSNNYLNIEVTIKYILKNKYLKEKKFLVFLLYIIIIFNYNIKIMKK